MWTGGRGHNKGKGVMSVQTFTYIFFLNLVPSR